MRSDVIAHGSFGVLFACNTEVMNDAVVEMIKSGRYERKEAKAILRHVRRGSRVLELGGGLGFISTFVGKRKAPAIYWVVEADPRLIDVIAETHRLNNVHGVRILNGVATSDAALVAQGTAILNLGANFWGSSIKKSGVGNGTVNVPVLSLSQLIGECRPNVLIIDIEGAEVDLFEGVDLQDIDVIIVEVHPAVTGDAAIQSMTRILEQGGFTVQVRKGKSAIIVFKRSIFGRLKRHLRPRQL